MPKLKKNYRSNTEANQNIKQNNKVKKMKKTAIKRAMEDYQMKVDLKKQQKKRIEERKQESANAVLKYKKRKHERYKKLCKKTKNGQPIMKYQIEHLLEKIKKQMETE